MLVLFIPREAPLFMEPFLGFVYRSFQCHDGPLYKNCVFCVISEEERIFFINEETSVGQNCLSAQIRDSSISIMNQWQAEDEQGRRMN